MRSILIMKYFTPNMAKLLWSGWCVYFNSLAIITHNICLYLSFFVLYEKYSKQIQCFVKTQFSQHDHDYWLHLHVHFQNHNLIREGWAGGVKRDRRSSFPPKLSGHVVSPSYRFGINLFMYVPTNKKPSKLPLLNIQTEAAEQVQQIRQVPDQTFSPLKFLNNNPTIDSIHLQ